MGWTRETKWVQGALLTGQSLRELCPDASESCVGVAISHSCDIANENLKAEPTVEFILAEPIENCDGNFTGAKNPRRLHLQTLPSGGHQGLELLATQKTSFQKTELSRYQPDGEFRLTPSGVAVLQSWLAARYKRQALPDSLQERLKPLFKTMEKQGVKNVDAILGYWLDYGPREELPPEEPYEVGISIVYSLENSEFEKVAEEIATALSKVEVAGVDLSRCGAYSEEEFTLRDLREQLQYRAEHLSYRTNPHGPTV